MGMKAMSATKAMKAMKATKAMKAAAMKSGAMTVSAAYSSVAASTGLKPKDVKGVVEGLLAVAAEQLKKNGSFKVAGVLNLKPAQPARKGVNPFTKEHCVFKARPASKTVK